MLCTTCSLTANCAFLLVSCQSTKEEEEAEGKEEEKEDKGEETAGEKDEAPTEGEADHTSPQEKQSSS